MIPAAQGTSSRIRHQTKDGRNAFRVPLYEFALLIAFFRNVIALELLGSWRKACHKRVSYREGKCDKVNLSLTEILGVLSHNF